MPTLGQYTAPDPLHRMSAMTPGPQTYSYAAGRPLVNTDPTGRLIVDRTELKERCCGDKCDEDNNEKLFRFGRGWDYAYQTVVRSPTCAAKFREKGIDIEHALQPGNWPDFGFLKEGGAECRSSHMGATWLGGKPRMCCGGLKKPGYASWVGRTILHEIVHAAGFPDPAGYEVAETCIPQLVDEGPW